MKTSYLHSSLYWGIALTVKSILLSLVSAVLFKNPRILRPDWIADTLNQPNTEWENANPLMEPHNRINVIEILSLFSLTLGIFGIFHSGILVLGAFMRSKVVIIVWMFFAIFECLFLVPLVILCGICNVWLLAILNAFCVIKTGRAIFIAQKAREEINNGKIKDCGSKLDKEYFDNYNIVV